MVPPQGLNVHMDAVRDFVNVAKARTRLRQGYGGQAAVFLDPKPFLAFAAFGPAGRDGRLGTEDDLQDPFAPLLARTPE